MGNMNGPGKVRREDERIAAAPADSTVIPADGKASQVRDVLMKLAVIVLAGLWIYTPSYHGDWLWDDDQSITANPTTQGPYSLAKFWLAPEGADYFPLTATGFWLQWQFFGMSPTGYHVVNVVLHILGALAFWWLLHVMRVPGAWLGGFVFAVHPICVESVSWVSELKNTLSQPLFFLACGYFVQFSDSDTSSPEAWRKYLLSMVMFLLAMFAKTSVVMFPVVILLYAWWKRGRVTVKDIIHSAPFFLISLILGLLTIYYQHGRAIGQEKIIVGDIWTIGGFLQRFAIAGMAIVFYLWKSIWPFDLLPIYPRWEVDPPKIWQFLPWPLLLAAAWWLWNRRGTADRPTWQRDLLFCLGFFVLILVPVLGFVTISYMRITWVADHFLYLPMASIIAFLTAAGMHAYGRLKPAEQPLAIAGCAAVLAILTFSSFRYAHAWANEDALWNHTLATNHEAWQAHNRLGAKKFARGDIDGAFYHFTNSTRLRPDLGETHNNLGTALSAKGRLDEAIKEFAEACRVTPHVPAIHVNLANALAAAGRFAEAAAKYREILTHAPLSAPLWNNYAVSLYKQGDKQESVEAFRKALSLDPNLKDAREGLAVALGEKPEPAPPQPPPGGQMPMALPQSPTLGAPPAVGPSSPLFP